MTSSETHPTVAAVEAGGTKVRAAIVRDAEILADITVPTTTPEATIAPVIEFFAGEEHSTAIGIGTFGPVGLDQGATDFGHITTTPKPGWSGYDLAGILGRSLGLPVAFDTDVAAAALGEWTWGAARDCPSVLYLTLGTGIGGGLLVDGQPHHGRGHPEMGHIEVRRRVADTFAGVCAFHGDCFEGLASGPALAARWGVAGEDLDQAHEAWDLEAHYIAQALRSYTYAMAPHRIVVGGGVMHNEALYGMIRGYLRQELAGYASEASLLESLDEYVVPPGLGQDAGLLGAAALAQRLLGST